MASASLAQVHRAKLKPQFVRSSNTTGNTTDSAQQPMPVAVKVQHLHFEKTTEGDLFAIEMATRVIAFVRILCYY